MGVTGALPINSSYSPSGNLLKKSDNGLDAMGAYAYGANGCGPHGVGNVQKAPGIYRTYGCDANGNVVAGNEINAVYDFTSRSRVAHLRRAHYTLVAIAGVNRRPAKLARLDGFDGKNITIGIGVDKSRQQKRRCIAASPSFVWLPETDSNRRPSD